MKLTVKSIQAIGEWRWKIDGNLYKNEDDRVCAICNFHFDLACPTCKSPGDGCGLLEGKCGHIFHLDCIEKWLASDNGKGKCPLDRSDWENVVKQ